jgi:hypothetical protein
LYEITGRTTKPEATGTIQPKEPGGPNDLSPPAQLAIDLAIARLLGHAADATPN